MGSDGNYYAGDTGWHSDGGHKAGDPMHIKLLFYLDHLTRDTGALRVIPGSHWLFGDYYADTLQKAIGHSQDLWGMGGAEIPSVALEVTPGDLAVSNHNTKHAAFGGGIRRRMFTMNLCQRYPDDRLEDLREYIGGAARFLIERTYSEKMVGTASAERWRHLEQVRANDGHLACVNWCESGDPNSRTWVHPPLVCRSRERIGYYGVESGLCPFASVAALETPSAWLPRMCFQSL